MNFTFNAYYTLIAAVIVLLIGKFLVNKITILLVSPYLKLLRTNASDFTIGIR